MSICLDDNIKLCYDKLSSQKEKTKEKIQKNFT